jgi:hypothetical protein
MQDAGGRCTRGRFPYRQGWILIRRCRAMHTSLPACQPSVELVLVSRLSLFSSRGILLTFVLSIGTYSQDK